MLLQGSDQREDGFRNSATSRMGLIETIGKTASNCSVISQITQY